MSATEDAFKLVMSCVALTTALSSEAARHPRDSHYTTVSRDFLELNSYTGAWAHGVMAAWHRARAGDRYESCLALPTDLPSFEPIARTRALYERVLAGALRYTSVRVNVRRAFDHQSRESLADVIPPRGSTEILEERDRLAAILSRPRDDYDATQREVEYVLRLSIEVMLLTVKSGIAVAGGRQGTTQDSLTRRAGREHDGFGRISNRRADMYQI